MKALPTLDTAGVTRIELDLAYRGWRFPVRFNPIICWDVIVRTTQQFSITPPLDMAEAVEIKIKSGAYASVSEVVLDGMRALLERDAAVERWVRQDVVAGLAEYLADPSKGVLADAILDRIKARRAANKAR